MAILHPEGGERRDQRARNRSTTCSSCLQGVLIVVTALLIAASPALAKNRKCESCGPGDGEPPTPPSDRVLKRCISDNNRTTYNLYCVNQSYFKGEIVLNDGQEGEMSYCFGKCVYTGGLNTRIFCTDKNGNWTRIVHFNWDPNCGVSLAKAGQKDTETKAQWEARLRQQLADAGCRANVYETTIGGGGPLSGLQFVTVLKFGEVIAEFSLTPDEAEEAYAGGNEFLVESDMMGDVGTAQTDIVSLVVDDYEDGVVGDRYSALGGADPPVESGGALSFSFENPGEGLNIDVLDLNPMCVEFAEMTLTTFPTGAGLGLEMAFENGNSLEWQVFQTNSVNIKAVQKNGPVTTTLYSGAIADLDASDIKSMAVDWVKNTNGFDFAEFEITTTDGRRIKRTVESGLEHDDARTSAYRMTGLDISADPTVSIGAVTFSPVHDSGPVLFFDCPADLDGNGEVGPGDLAILLANWGGDDVGDFDGDCIVGPADLAFLLAEWGDCDQCGSIHAGDCFDANNTPGCADAACCAGVCDLDPFCCEVSWDQLCVDAALVTCSPDACGQAGDCCTVHDTPGCDQSLCCSAVCGQDPFCCEVNWDSLCVDAALDNALCLCEKEPCVVCPDGGVPEGEPCGADTNGGCNSTPTVFGSIFCGAAICGTAWSDGGIRDTDWYLVETSDPCTTLTATLTAAFDGVVFIVGGVPDCAPVVLGAAGDGGNCAAGSPAVADVGPGLYAIFVATADFEGFPCDSGLNDYTVALACTPCDPGPVCGDGAGPCFEPNGTPGCDDVPCCEAVCAQDPFCCDVEWDQICADLALGTPECGAPPCDLMCPDNGIPEGEPCGADTNGGCNSTPAAFGRILCGETICGNAWAEGGTRDTDWYLVESPTPCTLIATLNAEFNGVVFIVGGIPECEPIVLGQAGDANACTPGLPAVADVTPGIYVVFVAPADFDGAPCNSGMNDYILSVDCNCEPPPPVCGPGAGSCFEPNGTPGCEDAFCCKLICAQDPFCCDTQWDQICVDQAVDQCGVP